MSSAEALSARLMSAASRVASSCASASLIDAGCSYRTCVSSRLPRPSCRATCRCGTPSATSRRISAQSSTEITQPICLGGLIFARRYGLVFKRRRHRTAEMAASATSSCEQDPACLGHPCSWKLDHTPPERILRQRVQVVEVRDAVRRPPIVLRREFQFRHQAADGTRERSHDQTHRARRRHTDRVGEVGVPMAAAVRGPARCRAPHASLPSSPVTRSAGRAGRAAPGCARSARPAAPGG